MLEYRRLLRLRVPDAPLTAEDLALLETPDEALYKRAYVFSFNVEKTKGRIRRRRKWEQVIQTHLHLDHVVTQMLVEGLLSSRCHQGQTTGVCAKARPS